MKVSRRVWKYGTGLNNLGIALVAMFLTIGLNSMQVSAAKVYFGGQSLVVNQSLKLSDSNIFYSDQVIDYPEIEYAEIVAEPPDCLVVACIALTFDDGPNPNTTPQILDALERVHVKATFFVIGNRVVPNTSLLKRMQDEGHEVGNHSWSHADLTKLNAQQIKDQITLNQMAVTAAGLPAPRYFRPPYEARNDMVRQSVDMPFILWNVDTKDWAQKSSESIVSNAVNAAKPGSIILMHDINPLTVQALPKILEQLKSQYQFVTVSQLLNLPVDAKGEYFNQ